MDRLIKTADFALGSLKNFGADIAQCVVRETEKREFNVDGGEFSLFRTLFDRNVGLTAFKENKKGSVAINRFDEESITSSASDCILAAESSPADEAWEICSDGKTADFVHGAPTPDTEKLFERTKELLADIKERYPKILIEQMIVWHTSIKQVYANSFGNRYTEKSGYYIVSLMYSGHDGEKSSSFYGSDVTLDNLDTRFIDCARFASELSEVERQIDTTPVEGKFVGKVVIAPGCLAGDVFGGIVSCFASDGVLIDGSSIWKDKLGQKVADERITVSFRPYDDRIVCGQRYTGEGYIAEDYDFIRDGVLNSFVIGKYAANKTGNKAAPNTSFSMIVKPGERSIDEIIADIDRGILVGRFSGGSPAPSGEFSGVAKNGFLIENGKLKGAISETMISGNLAEMLNNLVEVSSDVLNDGGLVVPYMVFDGITVSGK